MPAVFSLIGCGAVVDGRNADEGLTAIPDTGYEGSGALEDNSSVAVESMNDGAAIEQGGADIADAQLMTDYASAYKAVSASLAGGSAGVAGVGEKGKAGGEVSATGIAKKGEVGGSLSESGMAAKGIAGTSNFKRLLMEGLAGKGYVVSDTQNVLNTLNHEKLLEFIEVVEAGGGASAGNADSAVRQDANRVAGSTSDIVGTPATGNESPITLEVISVDDNGSFTRYLFSYDGGAVDISRDYYTLSSGEPSLSASEAYEAYEWKYDGGWLFTEEYRMKGYDGAKCHDAFRVLPIDGELIDLNEEFILPLGYGYNNVFTADWDENDFGKLDFYDIFDKLLKLRS